VRRPDTKAILAGVKENLAELRREIPAYEQSPVDVKAIRAKSGLSQSEFASCYGFSVRTLQDWELGRTQPAGAARAYLTVIDRAPRAVSAALASQKSRS
jgi:putative transcriptional regulator